MHAMLSQPCLKFLYNFILKCFQAPAGEVAEDDGEHGKNIILKIIF